MKLSLKVRFKNPGPAISTLLHTMARTSCAPATTASATSRGLRPSCLAMANAPLAWASARSLGRTTGSASAPPTATKAGWSSAATVATGSAIETTILPHCRRGSHPTSRGRLWGGVDQHRALACSWFSCPRSSGDRASVSGTVCGSSNLSEGATSHWARYARTPALGSIWAGTSRPNLTHRQSLHQPSFARDAIDDDRRRHRHNTRRGRRWASAQCGQVRVKRLLVRPSFEQHNPAGVDRIGAERVLEATRLVPRRARISSCRSARN